LVVILVREEFLIPGGVEEDHGEGPRLDPGRNRRLRIGKWSGSRSQIGRQLAHVQILPKENGRDDHAPTQKA
jgi:hypothetical protein